MTAALLALAERLEAATGPDREIDQDLFCDLGLCPRGEDGLFNAYLAPRYTASLDAAVSLIEHFGMSWSRSMEGFICLHDREGAGTFRPDTDSSALPIKLLHALVRALITRAEAGDAPADGGGR